MNPVIRSLYLQEAGNSGGVGDVASNIGGLQQRDRLRGRKETLGAVVAKNGVQKSAEC